MTDHDRATLARPDPCEATHRLVPRGTGAERIDAENRLAAVALGAGDRAALSVEGWLADHRPRALDRLAAAGECRTGEGVPGSADREYLVDLPAGTDAVLSALTVPGAERDSAGPAGEASWRAWAVHDLLVVDDDGWVYHSIPHEGQHVASAAAAPSFPDGASAALSDLPSALVPTEPLVAWNDGEYAVLADRVRLAGETVDLDRLRRVFVDRDRLEVVLDWVPDGERAGRIDSRLLRTAARAVVAGVAAVTDGVEPPHRVRVDDPGTLAAVEDALAEARETVGYGFALEPRDGTDSTGVSDAGGSDAGGSNADG